MSRWWTEHVANLDDQIGLDTLILLLLVAAGLLGAAWYFYPAWLPWRWWPSRGPAPARTRTRRRWRWSWSWLRWRRRKRPVAAPTPETLTPVETEELPDLPTEAFVSLADQLAAQGRFAEAVRERLRGIVRELVDAQVIESRPGWTVTELARAAGVARPSVHPPLSAASLIFSDIWYGERPAGAEHDRVMRDYAGQVHDALVHSLVGGAR